MIRLQQPIQARLGFSNICVNKTWRLYWMGRLVGCPRKPWEFEVMTVDGPRTAVITVYFDSQTGFKVSLSGSISQAVFESDEELTYLLCYLRDKLRAIFDGQDVERKEAA